MTQQDDITQRERDNETNIASAAKEWATPENVQAFPMTACAHIAGLADALLSKLRAPVGDERAAQEYGSPADVAQRIEQYLAQDGRMNSGTQLLYEAMKALRASQGDRNDG